MLLSTYTKNWKDIQEYGHKDKNFIKHENYINLYIKKNSATTDDKKVEFTVLDEITPPSKKLHNSIFGDI